MTNNARQMLHQPKRRWRTHGSSSSEETHDSMPELIPVSPPKDPSPEPELQPKRRGGYLRRTLMARNQFRRQSNTQRPCLDTTPVNDTSPVDHIEPKTAGENTDQMSPLSLWMTTQNSSEFGKRANALVAALDQVAPTRAIGANAAESPAAALVCEQSEMCTSFAVESTEESICTDGAPDEVEFSAVAKRRVDEAFDVDMDLDDMEDSDNECDDGDNQGAGNPRGAKRHKSEWAPPITLPPGVPAVMPASELVAAAVTAAVDNSANISSKTALFSCGNGSCEEETQASSSFGPRFNGLPSAELAEARARWTLHSLANVKQTSSKVNQEIATTLFNELRWRRESHEAGASITLPATDADTGNDLATCSDRPMFQRSAPRHDAGNCMAPSTSSATMVSIVRNGGRPGEHVAKECVAGMGQRRKATESASSLTTEGACVDSGAPQSRKRVPVRGTVCTALDEFEVEEGEKEELVVEPFFEQAPMSVHGKQGKKPNRREKDPDGNEEGEG